MSLEVAGTFQRQAEHLPQVFALVDSFLAGGAGLEDQRFLLTFALEELFTNAVKYNPGAKGAISVRIRVDGGEMEITLTDSQARRFDPTTDAPRVDPSLPLEARKPGGLGLHLLKNLMDRIEYHYADPVSTIQLYKKLE